MTWTDEKCDELRRLWAEGYSASAIAAELGIATRNAVIGKAHRLGLDGRAERKQAQAIREPRRKPERRPKLNVGKVDALTRNRITRSPPFDGSPITLFELSNWTCRWPVSDDVCHMFYCGVPEADLSHGRPYCEHHTAISFPPRSRP